MSNKPRYRIDREIGRGAFGVVYLAHDNLLRRSVALKVMTIPDALSPGDRERLVDRFHREARAAAGMSHPNVVTIHDIARSGDRHFISMEYLEGSTLASAMKDGRLETGRALEIAREALAGLEHAHARGVVHRDVKPDNIFIEAGGRVKLVDFGLARVQAATTMTSVGAVMGSPGYISPEVVDGRHVGPRSDVFSFGVVLYEMLTGERPFGPDTPFESFASVVHRVVSERPAPPSSINASVPPDLDAFVLRCLEKDPASRFADAGEAGRGLASLRGLEGVVPPAAPGEGAVTGIEAAQTVERYRDDRPSGVMAESLVEGWEAPAAKRRWVRFAAGAAVAAMVAVGIALALVLIGGGGGQSSVPNLINLSAKQARRQLAEAGLEVGAVTEGFSYDIWKGKVMRQMPGAGTAVQAGTTVDVVISLGQDVVQVPDVSNQPMKTARQTLESFGFKVKLEKAYDPAVPAGNVIRTRPGAGTLKDRGHEVIMVVNTPSAAGERQRVVGERPGRGG